MKTLFVYLIVISPVFFGNFFSNTHYPKKISEECQGYINVKGRTNINQFEFTTQLDKQTFVRSNDETKKIFISIPVKNFKTDKRLMYREFLSLIEAEKHPNILLSFTAPKASKCIQDQIVNIPVDIDMAGSRRTYKIPMLYSKCEKNQYTLFGFQPIKLTDFNLVPPQKASGLIKVDNTLFIDFSVVFLE